MQSPTAKLRSPEELVTFLLPGQPSHGLASITHRQNLVKFWSIPRGATILEIGCGQGDFTIPAADAIGPTGHITAIDPCDPALGHPPFGKAQSHVTASPVGGQVTFVRADGLSYLLDASTGPFDYVVLSHSVWYLRDATLLKEIMAAVRRKTKVLLTAEYALSSSVPNGKPHILAALVANALESYLDGTSLQAVHNAISPNQIEEIAKGTGCRLGKGEMLRTPDGEKYAWREIMQILGSGPWESWDERVGKLEGVSEKGKVMLRGMRDALRAAVEGLEGGIDSVVNMDVWAARWEREEE